MSTAPPPHRSGVIHDIGYRSFTGRRRPTSAIALSLYRTSLANAFGIGRSGKSKIVPWTIAAILMVPALVLAGIILQLDKMSLGDQADMFGPLSTYFGFPFWMQLPITIFVAVQAPALISRDLRYRSIVLYFARPLSRTTYVLMRLFALATAIFAIIVVPLAVWYGVAMTSSLDKTEHSKNFWSALVGVAVLSFVLAAVGGLISALTSRAGLAVAAVIVVLMVSSGFVTSVLGMTYGAGNSTAGLCAAALSPFTAVAALIGGLFHQPMPIETLTRPGTTGTIAFVVVCLAWVVLPTVALIVRMRKAASL